jgi:hypothetical protein
MEALRLAAWEMGHALEFLDDLELSDNEATDQENTQASAFHMCRAGLRRAREACLSALSLPDPARGAVEAQEGE